MLERNLLSNNYSRLCERPGFNPQEVTLLAATKTQSAETIAAAHALGVNHVGENYLAEALPKIAALQQAELTWHFIGRVQSNKTQAIAQHFDWVHCIDRYKIARRLAEHRQEEKPLNVLIQVNIDQDPNKGGIDAQDVWPLAEQILTLPKLHLRGLMSMLNPDTSPRDGYRSVAQLATQIRGQLVAQYSAEEASRWDTLSMGMSGDLDEAIAAGATIVRVGTALFGPRVQQPPTQ